MKKKSLLALLLATLALGGCNDNCECPSDEGDTSIIQEDIQTDFSESYKEVAPSVVMVRVQKKTDTSQIAATGSGVVYDQEGNYAYILTNAHVLEGATDNHEVEVIFSDSEGVKTGETELAEILGRDYKEDVAVLRIPASNKYKVAKIGDSSKFLRGQNVYAVGTPFGEFFNDLTSGVVSSYNVGVDTDEDGVNDVYVVTHTAVLNEGNSGGGLFNTDGELVGISTLKYNIVDGKYGALPINYFLKVANYIRVHKTSYTRPTLNISVLSVADMGVNRVNYGISSSVTYGLYVKQSSETATIAAQSIITRINDVKINSIDEYITELLKYSVGDTVQLTLINKTGDGEITRTVQLHA